MVMVYIDLQIQRLSSKFKYFLSNKCLVQHVWNSSLDNQINHEISIQTETSGLKIFFQSCMQKLVVLNRVERSSNESSMLS